MLNSKSYTYQSLRVKPLEISYSSVNFFSDRDEVLLASKEFVLIEELGIRQCGLPTSEEHDSPEEFDSQISDRCCAMRQLSQNIYPPNSHIIEGHLCLIMSGCSLGYINSRPLQPLAGWLFRDKLTLVIESIPSSEDFERK